MPQYNKNTQNIDFDILQNEEVVPNTSDASLLTDIDSFIPSDDVILAFSPTLTVELPFRFSKENRTPDKLTMIRGYERLAAQNFKNLMLTSPGERVMDINFGVGLRRFLFEQDIGGSTEIRGLRGRITSQSRTYLPYIQIVNISFSELEENHKNKLFTKQVKVNLFIPQIQRAIEFQYPNVER